MQMRTNCKQDANNNCLFFALVLLVLRTNTKKMKVILTLFAAFMLLGCNSEENSNEHYVLQGAWTLHQVEYPYDRPDTYYKPERTLLRLYDSDSIMYQCWLTKTESGLIISPDLRCTVTLIDKGRGEYVYIEDDNPLRTPLGMVKACSKAMCCLPRNAVRPTSSMCSSTRPSPFLY